MPPKVQFSRDQILNTALDLVIHKGIDALSARVLARKLGCSVAPIYVNFSNTNELFLAVMDKIREIVWIYSTKPYTKHGFFNIGIGQILIARDYPILFKDLLLKNPNCVSMDKKSQELMLDIMEKDEMLKGLTREQCSRILEKMAMLTAGLSIDIANNSSIVSLEKALDIMEESASQLIYAENKGFLVNKDEKIRIDLK